jgi:Na+/H+-dicarboxylate symporter
MSLSAKVLLGLALGIVTGLFFGESVGFLQMVGKAFIQLLQMTVLPYVVLSLLTALGQLTLERAAALAKRCGVLLLLLWAITLAMVLTFPVLFPNWESASFFSTSIVQEEGDFDFLRLYIPANPFFSLSNNIVPAVVLFSIALGVALIGVKSKEGLLRGLSAVTEALTRVTGFVVGLAPIGVFAIAASAAGTTTLTPLRYRDVIGPISRDALITAFATGNVFIVLPILAEGCKKMLGPLDRGEGDLESAVDVIVPTSYSFPSVGTVFSLSFVLFAAWISGSPLSATQYPTFALTGLFSMFGGVNVAIPFMLDLLRIPADSFQLFVVVSQVAIVRFEALLSAMYTLTLALLGAIAVNGLIELRWRRVFRYLVITAASLLVTMGAVHLALNYGLEREYQQYRIFIEMDLLYKPAPLKVYDSAPPPPEDPLPGKDRLDRILERGTVRVGYFRDALPFAFHNESGRLVGLDIEMAHQLARDMNIGLELVLVKQNEIVEKLKGGQIDIVMSGVPFVMSRAHKVTFSNPYMEQTLAFLVEDHKKEVFSNWENIQNIDTLKLGMINLPYYTSRVRQSLPQAKIEILNTPREFFKKKKGELDAFLYWAEAGSAWSLIYPDYSVAVPHPMVVSMPMVYPMPREARDLVQYVNTWIEFKKRDKTLENLYDYWILGKEAVKREPRWSVIRDVLHWID